MKVLVTGASGFLGREVVRACLAAGHRVRALVRPSKSVTEHEWDDRVEVFRADLRGGVELEPAFEGVDAACHLATQMSGDDAQILGETLVGTERFLNAMSRSSTRRLVLISSFSVYDWRKADRLHDESAPLLEAPHAGGAYATAKLWQERLTRRAAEEGNWSLTVLRPGFIWGRGHDDLDCVGQALGPWRLVFGPRRRMPLTHVKNCADAIVRAAEREETLAVTYDLHDGFDVSASRYARLLARQGLQSGRVVPIPSLVARSIVGAVNLASRVLFGPTRKLPSFFTPVRFDLRYRALDFSNQAIQSGLSWRPPLDFDACTDATWGPERPSNETRRAA